MSDDNKDAGLTNAASSTSSSASALSSTATPTNSTAPLDDSGKKSPKNLSEKSQGIGEWVKKLNKNIAEQTLERKKKEAEESKNDPNPIRAQMARFELLMTKFMTYRAEKISELFREWEKSCQSSGETTGQRARREMLAMQEIDKQLVENNDDISNNQEILSALDMKIKETQVKISEERNSKEPRDGMVDLLEKNLKTFESKKEKVNARVDELNEKNTELNGQYKKLSGGKDAANYFQPKPQQQPQPILTSLASSPDDSTKILGGNKKPEDSNSETTQHDFTDPEESWGNSID